MKNALKRATKKKSFKDLSGGQKLRVAVTAAVQIALQTAALRDLKKRPAALINGPKPAWFAASFINFIGPVAYFLFGRKR
ncbi:PLD nuclease N-terminal domain-containing protein [Arthrobacter sulfonylureivorans]|uniref:PLD nuclease N-terminal domain-containing protein n=1 Tax=Arthrobacter sulfonylureivorans TaxID=2486855 RepID=A0ABY3W7D9_9MICC|nr:PLD nuclease N-terminal domain-containing protein [Arthrobacter sulfonylureivorans]UNK46239.1 PLD nuclease N-terminal domain-containing protein [Arthrobacter sulfonylureivorans]